MVAILDLHHYSLIPSLLQLPSQQVAVPSSPQRTLRAPGMKSLNFQRPFYKLLFSNPTSSHQRQRTEVSHPQRDYNLLTCVLDSTASSPSRVSSGSLLYQLSSRSLFLALSMYKLPHHQNETEQNQTLPYASVRPIVAHFQVYLSCLTPKGSASDMRQVRRPRG